MEHTIVTTPLGQISGLKKPNARLFLGIPYAKAPVGDLRYKAPVPVEPWNGILTADHFGNRCPQGESTGFYEKEFYSVPEYEMPQSEDCLFLNIWAPADPAPENPYPVAFYIHGGAFMGGAGSEMEFDGEAYAARGVILVTINYRLGIYGFLAHPWLAAENDRGVAGNYGILDQICALTWVRDNIASFGGDPDNITVFGQSAGAMSTQTLVSSPLTRGMIAKAILQSGGSYGAGLHYDFPLADALSTGEEIVSTMGVTSLEELRALSAEELKAGFDKYMERKMAEVGFDFSKLKLVMVPVIDQYVLTGGYYETMDAGKLHDIPYMIGCNSEDIIMASPEEKARGERGIFFKAMQDFSLKEEEVHGNPAYVYYFTRQMPGDDAGAFHSAELWYVFGTTSRCWRPLIPADKVLENKILTYWTNFMKTSDVNAPDKTFSEEGEWRKCTQADPFCKTLDI